MIQLCQQIIHYNSGRNYHKNDYRKSNLIYDANHSFYKCYRDRKKFDNISFKSKHSFLNEFFDESDELNNLSQQNESTKERKINMHDKASELYIEFLEIYYYKYYELSGHKKNRVPIWP